MDKKTQPQMDQVTMKELVTRMAKLGIVREELALPRTGAGAGLRLSLVVQMVARYNTLSGEHLRRLCYCHLTPGSALKCYYREVKRLMDEGWLEREWQEERRDNVYWLGKWGRALETLNGKRVRGDRRLLWGHDLLIADFMTLVMVGARRSGGGAEWVAEYEGQLTAELRPDAGGRISMGGRELSFMLEADTGSEAENVFAQKYDKYHRYYLEIKRSGPGPGPGMTVLVVTKGKQERLARMIAAVRERRVAVGMGCDWLFTTEELMTRAVGEDSPGPTFERIWYDLQAQARRAVWQPRLQRRSVSRK